MKLVWVAAVVTALAACGHHDTDGTAAGSGASTAAPVTLRFAYSSEKKAWLDQALAAFAATNPKTPSGKPIRVDAKSFGSGEAQAAILDGSFQAHVYSPASGAYIALLNRDWQAKHPKPLAPMGEPLVLSPIVIAMWKPMAQALGWPAKDIGWSDIIRVSKDPRGWATYGHAEWGAFKLGHTHPELSNSGLLAVLAEAYAGAGKTRGLARADLESAKTRAYLGSIEGAIVHYGKSTALFTDQMLEHGPAYMSAAITYENLVIESYAHPGKAPFPLVAVYPVEGTFWSDHPYAILDADWVGPDERAAAQQLLAFLKSKPQQEAARALGFRPSDPAIAIVAPLDDAHGVDPKQPQTLLEVPSADVLGALLDAWRAQKKTADVMIVFDKSGSMDGEPLAEAKAGAKAFVQGLGDRDSLSIVFFDELVGDIADPMPLGAYRSVLLHTIDGVSASGGTSLYDAVARTYDRMLARAKREPNRIHAIIVMTDGRDESSAMHIEDLNRRFDPAHAPVKIFTIAYGSEADPAVLDAIARAAQGTSVKGTPDNIVQIYRDLSALF
jgi:Ca-activated chloride channel homolog